MRLDINILRAYHTLSYDNGHLALVLHLELGKEVGIEGRRRLFGQIEGVDVPEAFAVDERVENPESVVGVEEKVLKLQAFEVFEGADGGFQAG